MTGWIEILPLFAHAPVIQCRNNELFFIHGWLYNPFAVGPGETRATVGQNIRRISENFV